MERPEDSVSRDFYMARSQLLLCTLNAPAESLKHTSYYAQMEDKSP